MARRDQHKKKSKSSYRRQGLRKSPKSSTEKKLSGFFISHEDIANLPEIPFQGMIYIQPISKESMASLPRYSYGKV